MTGVLVWTLALANAKFPNPQLTPNTQHPHHNFILCD
uniref:Uncharacterized protein n=1 Tax=Rhizophora mucronata TaxID=61149 RepID=A0A2P2R0P4_RHIMU